MDENKMYETASLIASGRVGIMPTDTVYGLVGSALAPDVVERIYKVKSRPGDKPYIILIGDILQLRHFDIEITEWTQSFLDDHWPGPVSIGLPCPSERLSYLHRGTEMLVIRMPADEWLQELVINTGPIVATSANQAGKAQGENISEIREQLPALDFYIDGKTSSVPSRIALIHGDNDVQWVR